MSGAAGAAAAAEFDVPAVVPAATLADLRRAAAEMADKQRRLEELELEENKLRSELHHVRTRVLPDMFAAAGLQSLKLDDGREVVAHDIVSGALPKDPARREEAVRLLEQYDAGGVVRRKLQVDFAPGENERRVLVYDALSERGLTPTEVYDVHPMTLQALARERLRNGLPVDGEKLGLFIGRSVKVKQPRGRDF